jgi:hypothetical protein
VCNLCRDQNKTSVFLKKEWKLFFWDKASMEIFQLAIPVEGNQTTAEAKMEAPDHHAMPPNETATTT